MREKVNKIPKGWIKTIGATTAPFGYEWYNNKESRFSDKRRSALVKIWMGGKEMVWVLTKPKGKLVRTKKKYNALRVGKRSIYKDSTGKEFCKIKGKIYPKNSLEGYN